MEARLRAFLSNAVERAGGIDGRSTGPRKVAEALAELGFYGSKGEPFNEATVRAWVAGRRSPDPEIVLALAAQYEISLDRYAFGDAPPQAAATAALAAEVQRLRSRQGILTDWLLEVGYATGLNFHERVSQLETAERRAG